MYQNEICDRRQAYREDIIWKGQQEVLKAVEKERALGNLRLEQEQKRMRLSEMRRQAYQAEYTELEITQSGELLIKVQTPLVDIPKRNVSNFRLVDAVELRSTGGEKDVVCIFTVIDGQEENILLDKKKIGQTGYFLKKIVQCGGQLYIKNRGRKEELLNQLWQKILFLVSRSGDAVEICENRGWNMNRQGKLRFAKEGETLWEDIKKAAK